MYVTDGIAYAGESKVGIRVKDVQILDDFIMLITFDTGEQRIFDATELFEYPAFKSLKDKKIFCNPVIEFGVITWNDGNIDIAPETLYSKSYVYVSKIS